MNGILCSGSFMCDLIAADLPRIGGPGDLIYPPQGIQLHPGGHAANVSIDLIKLGENNVHAAGSVGVDLLGDYMINALEHSSVTVHPQRFDDAPTSKNIVLAVRGEDRRFYAELAANTLLEPGHVTSILEKTHPKLFYQGTLGGLRNLDPHIDTVLKSAREHADLTIVDVVRPYPGGWKTLSAALSLVDVLHLNDLESATLTGEHNPLTAARNLSKIGVPLILLTLGERGLIASQGTTLLKVPSFKVETMDTTGAGDAFCAGAMSALTRADISRDELRQLHPDTLVDVLLEASAAGAACVTTAGATTAVTWEKVDSLLTEQSETVRTGVIPL
jgi:sugar/nucleoside kinase (ribokinase family)